MSPLEIIQEKIVSLEEMNQPLARWRFLDKKIVFTNGCFDIIHKGHVDYLARAAEFGDIMIVGLNSDDSVKRLKGNGRPLQDQESRAIILSSLKMVNFVILFDEDTPFNLIKHIKPDFLVKGSDYKEKEVVGADIVKSNGGEVILIDFLDGYSTTSIINKLNQI